MWKVRNQFWAATPGQTGTVALSVITGFPGSGRGRIVRGVLRSRSLPYDITTHESLPDVTETDGEVVDRGETTVGVAACTGSGGGPNLRV